MATTAERSDMPATEAPRSRTWGAWTRVAGPTAANWDKLDAKIDQLNRDWRELLASMRGRNNSAQTAR